MQTNTFFERLKDVPLSHKRASLSFEPRKCTYKKHDLHKTEGSFVQLEIHAEALRRIILENKLCIEELRCTDLKTKELVKQALLENLTRMHKK